MKRKVYVLGSSPGGSRVADGREIRAQKGYDANNHGSDGSDDGDGDGDDDDDEFVEENDSRSEASDDSGSDFESEEEWTGDGDDDDDNAVENHHLCMCVLCNLNSLPPSELTWHGSHCQNDEDHDPASDYEDPLECAVCLAFCKSDDTLRTNPLVVTDKTDHPAHRQCDRDASESGGVKSAYDEGTAFLFPSPPFFSFLFFFISLFLFSIFYFLFIFISYSLFFFSSLFIFSFRLCSVRLLNLSFRIVNVEMSELCGERFGAWLAYTYPTRAAAQNANKGQSRKAIAKTKSRRDGRRRRTDKRSPAETTRQTQRNERPRRRSEGR